MKHFSRIEKIAPYLVLLIFVLVGFLGFSWQKIANLQLEPTKKETNIPIQDEGPKLSDKDLKEYAKTLGLDTSKFNSCLDSDKFQGKIDSDISYAVEELFVTGTPEFYLNGHHIDQALPYSIFREIIEFELNVGDWNKLPSNLSQYVSKDKINVNIEGAQAKGNKDAKITLIEVGDFECQYCGQFFKESLGQLMKEYVDTGKVYFVFRNYPIFLSHPNAYKAAMAGECAAEQGKFWEMHDLMYKSHSL